MKSIRVAAVFAVCALPVALLAQGGMGGMGGGRMGGGRGVRGGGRGGMGDARFGANAPKAPKFPSAKELEKLNPAGLLADKHKKLHLSDSSVAALGALKQRIFERNADLMAQYDSGQRAYASMKAPARDGGDTTQARERREYSRQIQSLRATLLQLSERRRTDNQASLALVPEARKADAAELLDKLDVKFGDLIPQPPVQRGGGRRGEGRTGERPPL